MIAYFQTRGFPAPNIDGQDQEWSCMPKEKRARLEAEPGLVDATQGHAGEGVVGQNIIDQLMKKEQEVADHLLKSGKVENKKRTRSG